MNHVLLVALGGGAGAAFRHLINLAALRLLGPSFPWGTMFINIAGSAAMGLLVGWLAGRQAGTSSELRLFLATGVLGGFTTFSAFSLDFAVLWERGAMMQAAGYVLASVALSIAGLFGGIWLMRGAA